SLGKLDLQGRLFLRVPGCPCLPATGLLARGLGFLLSALGLAELAAAGCGARCLGCSLSRLGGVGTLRGLLGPILASLLIRVDALLAFAIQLASVLACAHSVVLLLVCLSVDTTVGRTADILRGPLVRTSPSHSTREVHDAHVLRFHRRCRRGVRGSAGSRER